MSEEEESVEGVYDGVADARCGGDVGALAGDGVVFVRAESVAFCKKGFRASAG